MILPVLGFCAADFTQAERLLDYLAILKNKYPSGYILLVAAPDCHPEHHKRAQIAAKIGFEHVGLLTVGWPKEAPKSKSEGINWLFRNAAEHIEKHYKSAFVWLEPDSVPLHQRWQDDISGAYEVSPKLCIGAFMAKAGEARFLNRTAVYPNSIVHDLPPTLSPHVPFEFQMGEVLVAKASKSKLFQVLDYTAETGREKIRPDAVLLHGDKAGILLEQLISESESPKETLLPGKELEPIVPEIPEKIDGRSKAARAAKMAAATA